jgi:hypothetical protein
MDATRSKSRKRKAENDEDFSGAEAGCPCPYDCRKPPYQLAGNLDNLTLFGMAVTVHEDGDHTLHRGVVNLLIDAIDARPKLWHTFWRIDRVQFGELVKDGSIQIKRVHYTLRVSMNALVRRLETIQSKSTKPLGQSTQVWWS